MTLIDPGTPAVRGDDALLDVIATGQPVAGSGLTSELVSWREWVHEDSDRVLVDADTALTMIASGRDRGSRRMCASVVVVLIGLVAGAVMVGSLFGLVSRCAAAGDLLYPVREVLYHYPDPTCGE